MNPTVHCLECGAEVRSGEVHGLCAKCLLQRGLASELAETIAIGEAGARSAVLVPPPMFPFDFGGYRVLRLLGQGGMGAVYEAEQLETGRRVALKVLSHSLDSSDARKRFLREGRIAASVNHPNSVYIFGTEEIDGTPVIAMELVSGGTLQERVRDQGPLPPGQAVEAILQIIDGLEAAAALGVLHRDIKPSNCFIDTDGTVKVGDFGLSISTLARADSLLTVTGCVMGTPAYSSPEQLRGEALDLRSDIYSVGGTLYYLLTGRAPFEGVNMVALLATVLDKPAPSPRQFRPEIPEALARVVLRCLAKPAGDRFKNYDELRRPLLPFRMIAPAPARLGLRFVAGVIDYFARGVGTMLIVLAIVGDVSALTTAEFMRPPQWIWICAVLALWEVAYFVVPEGLWGASMGKALVGLRVVGINRNAPGIPRALVRSIIYLLAGLVTLPLADNSAADVAPFLYLALLWSTARRRNGFAMIHDWLTHTRVVEKSAYDPREAFAQVEESLTATDAMPKVGPYHALTTLRSNGTDELILGFDMRLLRRVWIRKVPPGTAPVPAGLRHAGRPGRLRWLQGRRDEAEAWDAYEALPGAPLSTRLGTPQPWKLVRHWLLDLAAELDVASRDGTPATLALDHVWITAGGGAKLLDFRAPGLEPAPHATASIWDKLYLNKHPLTGKAERRDAGGAPDAGVFLNHLAICALEGTFVSVEEARVRAAGVPVPLAARSILRDLRSTTDVAALAARLQPLTHQVPHVSRRRRFGLTAGCVLPALAMGVLFFAIRSEWSRQNPEVQPLSTALKLRSEMAAGGSHRTFDHHAEEAALDLYIAGRFGKVIRNPDVWSAPQSPLHMHPGKRASAERILAAHPNPTPAELERARAVLAPALDERGEVRRSPVVAPDNFLLAPGALLLYTAFFTLAGALLFRGGLLMHALRIAVVRRDGSDASRLRMVWRAVIAWSPLFLGPIAFPILGAGLGVGPVGALVIASFLGLLIAGVVVWSALLPERGLHDRIAGTWLVPR